MAASRPAVNSSADRRPRRPRAPTLAFSVRGIEREGLVSQVAQQLRELILSGTVSPGTPLLQEQLATRLKVSRTPLREAFRVLEQEGLIRVAARNQSAIVIQLDKAEMRDLYEIRELLDGLAARRAARNHSEATVRKLEKLVASIHPHTPYEKALTAHSALHEAIVIASGNSRLVQMMPLVRTSAHMLHPMLRTQPARLQEARREHAGIVAAIKAGDESDAEARARQHIRRTMNFWLPDSAQ